MAVFEYKGIVVGSGKAIRGVRDADNMKVLRTALRRDGVLLTSAVEDVQTGKAPTGGGLAALFRRVSVQEVGLTTRQLATLVSAGIPLVDSVSAMTEQLESHELKRVLTQVRDRLNEGSSLAKALESHPHVFTSLYVSMVAAGEASGTLEQVLERLADFIEGQSKLRGKVAGALAYPALMLVIGSLLISVMMVVVVPKVTGIFASLDQALPWYTSLLITVSNAMSSTEMVGTLLTLFATWMVRDALLAKGGDPTIMLVRRVAAGVSLAIMLFAFIVTEHGWSFVGGIAIGLVIGGAVWKVTSYFRTTEGRIWRDKKVLSAPVFGDLIRMLAVSRFSRTLATLLKSGVPHLKAMEIVRNVLDNAYLEGVIDTAAAAIREGEPLAVPLRKSGAFPPLVTHMIAVGERSGQLEQMLENVARAYDTQVETRVQALTSLLEPIMMVCMGGVVGFIAFSILMPLIQMNDFVQ